MAMDVNILGTAFKNAWTTYKSAIDSSNDLTASQMDELLTNMCNQQAQAVIDEITQRAFIDFSSSIFSPVTPVPVPMDGGAAILATEIANAADNSQQPFIS